MSLWKLYRWIRKIWAIVVALAALSGIGPGALPVVPALPAVAPAPASAPATPARKVIGSCSTITDGKQWIASCVVDGASFTLPGTFGSHAAALKAIKDFREANA